MLGIIGTVLVIIGGIGTVVGIIGYICEKRRSK